MRKIKDLTGRQFGRLLAIYPIRRGAGKETKWGCRCSCGKTVEILRSSLTFGRTKSCGCLNSEKAREHMSQIGKANLIDLSGKKFGRWTVLRRAPRKDKTGIYWFCECACGTLRVVNGASLKNGCSKSCGCLRNERVRERLSPSNSVDLAGKKFGRLTVLGKSGEKKNGYIAWDCRCTCGQTIKVTTNALGTGNTKSCGCLRKRRGSQNPSWNPNLTNEDRELGRRIPGYAEWRTAVYKRDGFLCQCCKDKANNKLNAHHIESYANNPELRTAIENGITFCEGCHGDFHHQYGRNHNTRRQLEQFLMQRNEEN